MAPPTLYGLVRFASEGGVVASLSSPPGNFTGFNSSNTEIAGKWLQLLKEISPGIDRVVVIYNLIRLLTQYSSR